MENSKQTLAADTQIVNTTAAAATVVINIPNEEHTEQTVCPNVELINKVTPSPSPSPIQTPAKAGPQQTLHLYSAASMQSLAYDTDCSSASSTCCTRYGEHIYMQRCTIDMLEAGIQDKQKSKLPAKDNANHENVAVYTKVELYKNKWPIFIVLISLIEIAIFVYDYLSLQQQQQANAATTNFPQMPQDQQTQTQSLILPVPIPTDSVFIYRPDRRLEVWRFVSYMFLHANSFHLGFNVVVQLFYGIPLEVMHGSARIAIIYFAGVFAGSLGTSVVDSDVYLVGASGGVYALLAAHLANITLNFGQMRYAVAQLCSVVIFVTCDLAYAFYTQYVAVAVPSKTPPVSYIAHLTGALAGLTIGLLVLKNFEQRSYENVIWWLALGIYSAFTVFAVVFNLINTVTAQLMEEEGEVITQHLLHDLGVS